MPLRVTYHRSADLVADCEEQFARGGLLVRAELPEEPATGDSVELEIVAPGGRVELSARVIQSLPGIGVAVGFDPADPGLAHAVDRARAASAGEDRPRGAARAGPPDHEWVEPAPARGAESAFQRARGATKAEKLQLALHGGKPERAAILRDNDKSLHAFVLKNPNLQMDEVVAIARMTTVAPDALKMVAERREWAQRPEVAAALVRNPRTPTPLAVRLVAFVAPAELRQLAKSANLRGPVLSAVRRRVLG